MIILDDAGRHTTKLTANGSGALVFSASAAAADRTKVFYRRHKTDAWSPITALITGEDNPIGLIYRADLREALRGAPGEFEIAIEVADARGNTVRLESEPAFVVEPEHIARRRVVGR